MFFPVLLWFALGGHQSCRLSRPFPSTTDHIDCDVPWWVLIAYYLGMVPTLLLQMRLDPRCNGCSHPVPSHRTSSTRPGLPGPARARHGGAWRSMAKHPSNRHRRRRTKAPSLIACRSPSRTHHPQAGSAGQAGRIAISEWAGNPFGRPITQRPAGALACRALRDPWPPARPRPLQPTTLHDGALACPRCCTPAATSRPCAASLDESQPTRALPCSCRPVPVHVCMRACVPGPPRWGRPPRASPPHWHMLGTCCTQKSRHCALEWLHWPHARPVPRLCITPVSTAAIYPSASALHASGG